MREQEPQVGNREDYELWKSRLGKAGIVMLSGGLWVSHLGHPIIIAIGGATAFGGVGLIGTADKISRIITNNKKGQKENGDRSKKTSN